MKKTKTKTDPYDEIRSLLLKLPHKLQVSFALYCAKDVYPLVRDKDRTVVKDCLDTVELWLRGKATAEECKAAAEEYKAAVPAAYTAYAAAYTAYAAAYYTASADATYAAAHIAHYAANAKAGGNGTTFYNKAMKKYLNHLNEMIKDLTPIERTLFNV